MIAVIDIYRRDCLMRLKTKKLNILKKKAVAKIAIQQISAFKEKHRAYYSLVQFTDDNFCRMANSSPMTIWMTNVVGEPVFVNQAWRTFTGFHSTKAMSNKDWNNTIHPNDRKNVFAEYYQDCENRNEITTEYRLRNADGDWRWILDKGTPIYDENGVFAGYIGSAIDITERHHAQ